MAIRAPDGANNLFLDEVNHDSQNILYAQTIYVRILYWSLCKELIDDSLCFSGLNWTLLIVLLGLAREPSRYCRSNYKDDDQTVARLNWNKKLVRWIWKRGFDYLCVKLELRSHWQCFFHLLALARATAAIAHWKHNSADLVITWRLLRIYRQ